VFRPQALEHPVDLRAVAGMIGARQPVRLPSAAAEMDDDPAPAASPLLP
jgi:hypothetical protein